MSSEDKERYLIEKYHEYVNERHAERKYELYDEETLEDISYHKNINNCEEKVINQIENVELKDAIKQLNKRQQLIIDMVFFKGIPQQEVARQLGVSKQAISNSLNRIYQSLRKKIKKN